MSDGPEVAGCCGGVAVSDPLRNYEKALAEFRASWDEAKVSASRVWAARGGAWVLLVGAGLVAGVVWAVVAAVRSVF